jgi:ribose transport system ATP-binding protein
VTETVLRVENLRKRFGGVYALDGVSLEIGRHEVVGIVGENGAGKSTLLKMLAGMLRSDGGRIVLRGKDLFLKGPADAANAGIGMVHQEQSLLPNLSVAEKILLGHEDTAIRAGFYNWSRLRSLAAAQLDKLGSDISPSARTDALTFAERQLVELAKVLAIEQRTRMEPVVLLDEPTSMLNAGQIETVLAQIERLRVRASVVFISHRLEEVLRVCDRIYVLNRGRCVAEHARTCCSVADLQESMLSHDTQAALIPTAAPASTSLSTIVLSVRALRRAGRYHAVSFDLRAGEVVGIAGAEGSGRESLCRALFGAEAPDGGDMLLDGQSIRLEAPADAVRLGIGYVPADRRIEGIIAGLSVAENMTLAQLDDLRRGPFLDFGRERRLVRSWIERLRIAPASPQMQADRLSGGNQQKLVLARWLVARKPRILILDHPLRGLDVRARMDMIQLIRELAASGIGILLIADALDELAAMSDRLLVMKDGAVTGRFDTTDTLSERQILERMV